MESNLTVTIFSDEYRALLRDQIRLDVMLDLLIDKLYVSTYDGSLSLSGSDALEIVKEFAPLEVKMQYEALKEKMEEKQNE